MDVAQVRKDKRIVGLTTWAGLLVAACADGTIWSWNAGGDQWVQGPLVADQILQGRAQPENT